MFYECKFLLSNNISIDLTINIIIDMRYRDVREEVLRGKFARKFNSRMLFGATQLIP